MHTILTLVAWCCVVAAAGADRLAVCAATADLASLARAVGGERIAVEVFAKGGDDPHFVDARPGFVRALSRADVLIENGMELEIGWLPAVVDQARNAKLRPGQAGRIVASDAITPLGVPAAGVDRSDGDVHALGNPHYLLDPLCAWAVAELIRDRLASVDPDGAVTYRASCAAFTERLAIALVGGPVVQTFGLETTRAGCVAGTIAATARERGLDLGGWLGALLPQRGAAVIADHDQWPYFARTFDLRVVAFIEPKPGVPPSSKHLAQLIERMRADGVRAILVSPFFDAKSVRLVAEASAVPVAAMCHQVGARDGCDDYLATAAYNVAHLAAAFAGGGHGAD